MDSAKFKYFLAPILLAMAMAQTCCGQVADVVKEPRLQKPISIKLKIVQLPAALKELSKLTGVKLENVRTIEDLKITVFVKDEPAGLVLDKISSVLGCEWKADGDLFRLGMDNEERIKRERYVEAEESLARKEVETELNSIAELGSIDPSEASRELIEQNLARTGDPRTKIAYDPKRVAFLRRAMNPQDSMLGRFLTKLDQAKINAFWKGDVIAGVVAPALSPNPGAEASSSSGSDAIATRRPRQTPRSTPMFVQYDPLLYQVRVAQGGAVRVVSIRPARVVTQFAPVDELAKLPFGKEVLSWDQEIPPDGDLSKVSVSIGKAESRYVDKRVSIADFFEKAFDETHISVVADGFRTTAAFKDLNRGLGPLNSWLAKLKTDNHVFTRVEDGMILIRHGGFWRLRKFETPEELLASIEQRATKGSLTLDDYAALLLKLTPEQAKPFSIPNGTVTKFDTRPIEIAMPALLFYASLDSQYVAKAMQDGVIYAQLRSAQRQLFVDAALEGEFLGAASNGFGEDLLKLANSGDARGLGFLIRKGLIDVKGAAVDGQAMLFGASLSESSTYKIAVAE